jgi:hypothetical protein
MTWHLLQISDVLDVEFGSALAEIAPVLAWKPSMTYLPWFEAEHDLTNADPPLRIRHFPLLRGYARFPLSSVFNLGASQTRRMASVVSDPTTSPLICTTPYYAPVAEAWPGPVIYYLTDLMAAYGGAKATQVHRLDRRMCAVATLVCPNSSRLAAYLMDQAYCDPAKIQITPNATRKSNLLPTPPLHPTALPAEVAGLRRPIAGIIGNLAGNMDWPFLKGLVETSPEFTWLFVGPTSMPIKDPEHSAAREAVLQHPSARFVGRKPYGELAAYARAFDVAVLPYRRHEPTFSGSSTRFYEHLAACRPMIATRGFEELLHKEPLLRLVDTASEARAILLKLQSTGFDDGHIADRWLASREGTWQVRARTMRSALAQRWSVTPDSLLNEDPSDIFQTVAS